MSLRLLRALFHATLQCPLPAQGHLEYIILSLFFLLVFDGSGESSCDMPLTSCFFFLSRLTAGDDTAPQELRSKRQALDEQIATAKADWRSVQDKVDAANKQIVNGRAYKWNKDNYLGGSDHFVPVGQAHKQLAGAGYGHRYSIVDWLSGDRR